MNGSGADKRLSLGNDSSWNPRSPRSQSWIITKGHVWKPDNLIVLSTRFIINIFIELIAEKTPGLLNRRQIHSRLARLTSNNSVVSAIGPESNDPPRRHDRQIAHLCGDDMRNFQSKRKKKLSLFGDIHCCSFVSDCETRLEEHERDICCVKKWKLMLLLLWFNKSLSKEVLCFCYILPRRTFITAFEMI